MSDGTPLDEVVVTLKKELKVGKGVDEKIIKELKLREPTAGELSAAEQFAKKGGTEQVLQLLALVSGVHVSILKNMSGSDFKNASEVLGNFFGDTQDSGGSSSQT